MYNAYLYRKHHDILKPHKFMEETTAPVFGFLRPALAVDVTSQLLGKGMDLRGMKPAETTKTHGTMGISWTYDENMMDCFMTFYDMMCE